MSDGRSCGLIMAATMLMLAAGPAVPLSAQNPDTLPIGYGTLKSDDILVRLDSDQLEIQFLPLAEQVIRLLAPDTYSSLTALVRTKRAVIDTLAERAGVMHPTLVMVTFIGLASQARFTPEDLNVTSRGRLFRPVGIVPLSPTWSGLQLQARQQAVAVYIFEDGISFRDQLTVSYEGLSSDSWSSALRLLDQERARVVARALNQAKP